MAGRHSMVSAAAAMSRLVAALNRDRQDRIQPANDMSRQLDMFEKRNPPRFKGGFNPEGAQNWL